MVVDFSCDSVWFVTPPVSGGSSKFSEVRWVIGKGGHVI